MKIGLPKFRRAKEPIQGQLDGISDTSHALEVMTCMHDPYEDKGRIALLFDAASEADEYAQEIIDAGEEHQKPKRYTLHTADEVAKMLHNEGRIYPCEDLTDALRNRGWLDEVERMVVDMKEAACGNRRKIEHARSVAIFRH